MYEVKVKQSPKETLDGLVKMNLQYFHDNHIIPV